jgi:serine/threonine-protein kinase
MALVYLAADLRLEREVAVKIMQPDLASVIGTDRFLREIDLTAHLQHPNIVQVFDSGQAGNLLYFVMPYVRGESLRERLEREDQLPIEEALRITREVAKALLYAHVEGIVHRDVKPANIMLQDEQVFVTDFGIARALVSAGGEKLTATGIALGSAHYMSPEQATGSARLDPRSDQYSLACVTYEMLAGEPPFTGHTKQVILARHAVEPPPGLVSVRRTIPTSIEAAIHRALEKSPADRFGSLHDFVDALDLQKADAVSQPQAKPLLTPWRLGLAVVVVLVTILALAQTISRQTERMDALPEGLSASEPLIVVPISLEGGPSTGLSSDALTRLLSSSVSGEGGLKVISTDSTKALWESVVGGLDASASDLLQVAADMEASAVLKTTLLQMDGGWRVFAVIQSAPDGRELFRVEDFPAAVASASEIVEELARRILIHQAGEERHLEDLIARELPVLKSYLSGLESYHSGRYREAVERLRRAGNMDPSFALAAIELAAVARMVGGEEFYLIRDSALASAWANRRGLPASDSSYLLALAGTEYPNHTGDRVKVAEWERVARQVPSRWESQFHLGVALFETGPLLDLDVPVRRAAAAFDEIRQTHPGFAPALEYAIQLAALERDTAELTSLARDYLQPGFERDRTDFVRWLAATVDPVKNATDFEILLSEMTDENLQSVVGHAQLAGAELEWAELAATIIEERTVGQIEHWLANVSQRTLDLNLGRPGRAIAHAASLPQATLPVHALILVVEAMYWDGDTTLARLAVAEVPPLPESPPSVLDSSALAGWADRYLSNYLHACVLGLWSLYEGDYQAAAEMAERLILVPVLSQEERRTFVLYCRRLLDAEVATALADPDAATKVDELERLMLEGLVSNPWVPLAAQLGLSGLRERAGDLEGALATVRRRRLVTTGWGLVGLSSLLREEGRLAEATGDVSGAIAAYRHYLALRYRPEPDLVAEVNKIWDRLALLEEQTRTVPDR